MTSIAERIRQRRSTSMLTQDQVASVLKVPREHVAMWEIGTRYPNDSQLKSLSELFRISVESLTGQKALPESEWPVLQEQIRPTDPDEKIQLWREFLIAWSKFAEDRGLSLAGRQKPPKELMGSCLVSDARKASALATQVREHFGLGSEPIRDMYSFLDQIGVFVSRAPLGPLSRDGSHGISGLFYNHSKLGYCILVNSQTIPVRQNFTLAHEFAHALFHYSMFGLVSRKGLNDPKERFADAFAAHFLVPSKRLKELVHTSRKTGLTPFVVLQIAYDFGVSYKAMLYRMRNEQLISTQECQEWSEQSVLRMCTACKIDPSCFQPPKDDSEFRLPRQIERDLAWLSAIGQFNSDVAVKYFGSAMASILKPTIEANTGLFEKREVLEEDDDWPF